MHLITLVIHRSMVEDIDRIPYYSGFDGKPMIRTAWKLFNSIKIILRDCVFCFPPLFRYSIQVPVCETMPLYLLLHVQFPIAVHIYADLEDKQS